MDRRLSFIVACLALALAATLPARSAQAEKGDNAGGQKQLAQGNFNCSQEPSGRTANHADIRIPNSWGYNEDMLANTPASCDAQTRVSPF